MDYARAAALATKLIAANGRLVTFNQLAASADPMKPWRSAAPVVAASVQQAAVFLPISSYTDIGFTLTEDELNLRATEMVITGPSTLDLTTVHEVVDGEIYGIQYVKMLKPGPTVLLYGMGIKR